MKYTSLKITRYLIRCHLEVVALGAWMIRTPPIFVTVNVPSSDINTDILFFIYMYTYSHIYNYSPILSICLFGVLGFWGDRKSVV